MQLSLPSYLYFVISLCKLLLNQGYPLKLITTKANPTKSPGDFFFFFWTSNYTFIEKTEHHKGCMGIQK